jgi:hypothetical protein
VYIFAAPYKKEYTFNNPNNLKSCQETEPLQ